MRPQVYILILLLWAGLVLAMVLRSGKMPWMPEDYTGQDHVQAEIAALGDSKSDEIHLNSCSDEGLGVSFLCHFGWTQEKSNGITLFTIESNPEVKMKIVKVDMNILYIQQLNRDRLTALGRYADGFRTEEVTVSGLNAIKVKAFDLKAPNTRLSDYYFVHNKTLYGLMFSVAPKDRWDDYKFLFRDIVNSFKFR